MSHLSLYVIPLFVFDSKVISFDVKGGEKQEVVGPVFRIANHARSTGFSFRARDSDAGVKFGVDVHILNLVDLEEALNCTRVRPWLVVQKG